MKKILALIAITIFLTGCIPTETAPVVEEDITTPEVEVEETTTTEGLGLPEGVEFVSREDRIKAADEKIGKALEADVQIAEDKKKLDEISATRPLQVSDCEIVKNPEFKESCLVFAAASELDDE